MTELMTNDKCFPWSFHSQKNWHRPSVANTNVAMSQTLVNLRSIESNLETGLDIQSMSVSR